MNTMLIVAIVVIVFGAVIAAYNNGVKLRNYVREAFSTMDVYLKKRWDLIPNLIETVKGYATHEKDVFEKITELRNKNYTGLTNEQKMEINQQIGLGLAHLIAVAENYPDLKANESFQMLMQDLSAIETDIANSRKYYNGCVRDYNNYTEYFPTNIIAAVFGFKHEKMFEINEQERENVKVSF